VSGIAGQVSAGEPVEAALLERLAAGLAPRAPEGVASRLIGQAGLAHGVLRTGDPGEDVPQPLTLDGRRWIVADARIDGREALVRDLAAGGIRARADAAAAELILHAVARWGDQAPAHLLGDFAFAVWDAEERRLLCARDPFGFKPLYYARLEDHLVFSGSLDVVRLHPRVSDALDEEWIADFLVHGDPRSLERTVFADIRLLPPAHVLEWRDGTGRVSRYWSLPEESEPLRLGGPRDHAERVREVLREAVRDRLPRGEAALLLSGGRDSTALAATWRELADEGLVGGLRGYTVHHRRLMQDDEPRYAGLVAQALRIPHELLAVDDYLPFGRWEAPELYRPQPTGSSLLAIEADHYGRIAADARVLLTGQGGDALFRESPSRLTRLVASGHPLRALREAAEYVRWHGRLPRPGVRSWWRGEWSLDTPLPAWLRPALIDRTGIRERLHWPIPAAGHNLHPEARRLLAGLLWPTLGALWDPGATGVRLEVRHPYFDLRLVDLVLSIPPAQWYNDKGLLRIAMRGRLPAAVLSRPKTPVVGDALRVRADAAGEGWLGGRVATENVAPWVDLDRVPRMTGGRAPYPSERLHADLRPLALSLWLTRQSIDPR
jgi:asparagine synthase (glutamine-hydrolysing)